MVKPTPSNDLKSLSLDRMTAESHGLADEVADTIRDWLDRGQLKVGHRLPSERELVERLGISRPILREALSRLEALGVIEARTTRGRYVAGPDSDRRSETLVTAWLRQHIDQVTEFDELKALLEVDAIMGMTDAEMLDAARKARLLIIDQETAVEKGLSLNAADCDAEFHKLLCWYSGNRTLRSLNDGLIAGTRNATLAVYSLPEASRRSIQQHWGIVEAFAALDNATAAVRAREHTLDAARRYSNDQPLGTKT
jgi:GntR family transcriptional repressor for pyruvate dehydrogenase complex